MPRPTLLRRAAARLVPVAAAALTLGACGGQAPAVAPAPGVTPTTCGTVTLASNAWLGYDANLAVIRYLAVNELGCTVKIRKAAEDDSWKQVAAGSTDAIVENWGHDELKKKYIDDERLIVEGGLTGNKGVIGWYVPPWMAKTYPDITDSRNLKKYTPLFKTEDSKGKGQFLGGDPTFVTNDGPLLRNLGLDFTVVYAGSEDALIKAFRAAERDKTPLLGYFYSPQWLLSELPLAHVTLPPYTPGCDADPKTVACDYQPFDLDKIMNRKFAQSGSPAAELIKNFQWTDADQNEVARAINAGTPPDEAAKAWLDDHPKVWKKWLPAAQ
ncbi:ABC transporter substrate-binding protein [Kineosporia sp. A_224]|uniref:ABC transporter substrate-binding protein n=1 Tax=Kineosporia sp. A_224 TaxID=1962180 RepID=UPI000B4BCE40|nr:ABC transporter substrate-binding protein [Kineosporia sp. A_224]